MWLFVLLFWGWVFLTALLFHGYFISGGRGDVLPHVVPLLRGFRGGLNK